MGLRRSLARHHSKGYHENADVYARRVLTTTLFYRNVPQLEVLFDVVIPSLLKACGNKRLRIASIACSVGCEPYTLAIEAARRGVLSRLDISGYDIDVRCIRTAKKGVFDQTMFSQESVNGIVLVPDAILKDFFVRGRWHRRNSLRIRDDIRQAVKFSVLDILAESLPAIQSFDIVLLQNVLVHFSSEAADRSMTNLLRLTSPSACLVLGGSNLEWVETIDQRYGLKPLTERVEDVHEGWLSRRNLYAMGGRDYLALEPFATKPEAGICRYCSMFFWKAG